MTFKRTATALLAAITAITFYSPSPTQAQGYGPRLTPPEGALPGQRESGNRGVFKIRRLDEEGNVLGPNDNPGLAATVQVVEEFPDGSYRVTTVKEVKPTAKRSGAPTASTQPASRNDDAAAAAASINPALLPTMGMVPQQTPQRQTSTRNNITYNEPLQRTVPEVGRPAKSTAKNDEDYNIDYGKHKQDILDRLDLMGSIGGSPTSDSSQIAAAPEQPTRYDQPSQPAPAAITSSAPPAPTPSTIPTPTYTPPAPTPVVQQTPPSRTPTRTPAPTPIAQQTPPTRTPTTDPLLTRTPEPAAPRKISGTTAQTSTQQYTPPPVFQTQPTTRTSSASLPPAPRPRSVQETLDQAKQTSTSATDAPTATFRTPAAPIQHTSVPPRIATQQTTEPTHQQSSRINMRPLPAQRTTHTEIAPLPTAEALRRAQQETEQEAQQLASTQQYTPPPVFQTQPTTRTPSASLPAAHASSTQHSTYTAPAQPAQATAQQTTLPTPSRKFETASTPEADDTSSAPATEDYAASSKWDDKAIPDPRKPRRHRSYMDPDSINLPDLTKYAKSDDTNTTEPEPTQVADTQEPTTDSDKDITNTQFGRAVSSTWSSLKTGVGSFFKRSPDSMTSRKVSRDEPQDTIASNQASITRLDTEPHFRTEATDHFSASPEDYRYWAGYLPKVGPIPLRFASAVPEYDRSMVRFDRRQLVPLAAKIDKPNVQLPEPEPEKVVPQPPKPRPDLFPVSDNEVRALDVNRFVQDLSRIKGQDNDVDVPFQVPYQQEPQALPDESRAVYRQVP